MQSILYTFSKLTASCFYVSYVPAKLISLVQKPIRGKTLAERKWTGAGFMGSLFGLVVFLFLPQSISSSILYLVLGLAFSIFVSHFAEKAYAVHDDSRIVIDEWIGVSIALAGLTPEVSWTLLIPFFLFRFFDVFKGPWGHALQKLPGGFGVVMDDVFAGILANVGNRLIWMLIEK